MLIPAPPEELCLAFANTLSWRGRPSRTESLHDYAGLLAWLGREAKLPAELLLAAHAAARAGSPAAEAVFGEAIALREAVYRLFSNLIAAGPPAAADTAEDMARLNRALAQAPGRVRLTAAGAGYAWSCDPPIAAPGLLTPVLWSAADLLTRADHSRLRRCANDACLWLFLDQSKAGRRRWCDMSSCGNRAKAQRHYRKTKGA